MMYGWHGPGMFGFGGFGMLLCLIVLIAVGYFVLRFSRKRTDAMGNDSSRALDILKERYARGEIDKETYDRMKQELR